jgi:hypothetical protein
MTNAHGGRRWCRAGDGTAADAQFTGESEGVGTRAGHDSEWGPVALGACHHRQNRIFRTTPAVMAIQSRKS